MGATTPNLGLILPPYRTANWDTLANRNWSILDGAVGRIVIGFVIGNGAVGNNVGPMLVAPHSGTVTKCVVITKTSDSALPLTFRIKQNGTNVFATNPTVVGGTASGTVNTFTTLTVPALGISAGDVFQIDVLSGNANWQFTAQLE